MKRSRFTEEQIIAIPAGAGGGIEDGGCLPQPRREQCDLLQVEGDIRRHGGVAGAQAEGSRG